MTTTPAIAPADAVYGFAAWLTVRRETAGPFSRFHDSAQMAQLVAEYCLDQGWAVSEEYPNNITPMPSEERERR